ncbi:MAG: activase [Proteobacteria bacterium]|nr:activase [Pseudomonadota bacterium]
MKALGIDIGSRYIKGALIDKGEWIDYKKSGTTFNPLEKCNEMLREMPADRVVATGYGRHLLEVHGNIKTITEIKAFARGSRAFFSKCYTIIDIGGQDTKVIALNEAGNVWKFEMNDRCAAGTGKFMEIMAKNLGYSLEEFGSYALTAHQEIQLSSMCTVFAESEVVSLTAKGVAREEIAMAIHRAIINRVASMAKRFSLQDEVVFAGGCAYNPCLKMLLEQNLKRNICVASAPEMTGAIGAALFAEDDGM